MAINRLNPDYPDAGIVQLIPTSLTLGSGSGSVDGNGAVTFSGVSSISLNGCFTASYDNYKIYVNMSASNVWSCRMRLGSSGTPNTASTYNLQSLVISNTSVTASQQLSTNQFSITDVSTDFGSTEIDVMQPFNSSHTLFNSKGIYATTQMQNRSGRFAGTTSFTDIVFYPDSPGTITGTIRVYGYRN